ncbi:Xre family transcriptional regulator [Roseovarius halotolerans]|uniref:Helix-turn-helix domain protein n=1 Tax=Roseovarius halotolerans TaxID=505353 RepID=A0A1X6YQN6_9RHOB|nr:Xre family transcriptional regulator [Roseovarius halotolerans]SLN27780.1 Helix-turn-helix domain protein [Roseovarius halotolerans]
MISPSKPTCPEPDPSELRAVFGQNLRHLSKEHSSIASLCRKLGINRTQFNRYLTGESFPRPDVLHKICRFFGVDARILLEPVATIKNPNESLLDHPQIRAFFGRQPAEVPESLFPSGFYRFIRGSFYSEDHYVVGLVHVTRRSGYTFIRGYEPSKVLGNVGIRIPAREREYRGVVLRQDEGVMAITMRRHSMSCSITYLTLERIFPAPLWEGFAARSAREKPTTRRVGRVIYQHLGESPSAIRAAARQAGLKADTDIQAPHLALLRNQEEFR